MKHFCSVQSSCIASKKNVSCHVLLSFALDLWMLRKIIFFFCMTLFCTEVNCHIVNIEGRAATFIPRSSIFREIYGRFNPSYQLEATLLLPNNLKWWNNFSYLHKKGKTVPLKVPAEIGIYFVSTGLKYVFNLPRNIEISLGAGGLYSWPEEKNKSDFVKRINKKNGAGAILKLDASKVFNWFVFSIFTDYQFQKLTVTNELGKTTVDLNGLYVGLSAGFRF